MKLTRMLITIGVVCVFAAMTARAGDAPQQETAEGVPFSTRNPDVDIEKRPSVERGAVTITCDPDAAPEFDPLCGVGTDPNGGCSSPLQQFVPIECGQKFCGTSRFSGADRDTDWYEVTILSQKQLTWRVTAEFRVVAGLVAGTNGVANCALATSVNPFSIANAGETASVTVCLGAGTWWFFVAPDFGPPSPPTFGCGEKYQAELLCVSPCPGGACCFSPAGCQNVASQAACLSLGGRYQGNNVACSAAACLAPPNDGCANAPLIACGQTVTADLRNATILASEPEGGCGPNGVGSVWYRIMGTGQPIGVSTCDSPTNDPLALNTKIVVYAGNCQLNTWAFNGCSAMGCGPTNELSSVCFNTNMGETYYIQVQAPNDAARARYTLKVTCPCITDPSGACCLPLGFCGELSQEQCASANGLFRGVGVTCAAVQSGCPLNDVPINDDCDGAFLVNPSSTTTGTTIFSSVDLVSTCGLPLTGGGVWYKVVGNGRAIKASTCSPTTDFDTRLHIYCNNCASPTFVCVGANEDAGGTCVTSSEVTWCTANNAVYYILVSGFDQQVGSFGLVLSDAGTCTIPAVCTAPCLLTCPNGAAFEGEDFCFNGYVDTTNGGCGSSPEVYGTITPGQTVCGHSGTFTSPGGGLGRDTDWFRFTLVSRSNVTWSVRAEFLVQAAILNTSCAADQAVLAAGFGNACQVTNATATLDPGTYTLFVSPQFFQGVDCTLNWYGTLTATPTSDNGACCFVACPKCRLVPEEFCVLAGGVFFYGAGTSCAQSNCLLCPGDVNGDAKVDGSDLSVLLSAFERTAAGDTNCDGITNGSDLSVMLSNFATICD